jgi:prepilin-type N-terminal cleavage/methylation domain-containing protein
MKKYRPLRGFTLIELLVTIAIIGILSGVVLAALAFSRTNAENKEVMAQMVQFRTETGVIHNETDAYDTVCTQGSTAADLFAAATIRADSTTAGKTGLCVASGTDCIYYDTGAVSYVTGTCTTPHPEVWAASILLKNNKYFCMDSTGYAGEQDVIGIDDVTFDADCQN